MCTNTVKQPSWNLYDLTQERRLNSVGLGATLTFRRTVQFWWSQKSPDNRKGHFTPWTLPGRNVAIRQTVQINQDRDK